MPTGPKSPGTSTMRPEHKMSTFKRKTSRQLQGLSTPASQTVRNVMKARGMYSQHHAHASKVGSVRSQIKNGKTPHVGKHMLVLKEAEEILE